MTQNPPINGQIPPHAFILLVLLTVLGQQDPDTLAALTAAAAFLPHIQGPEPRA